MASTGRPARIECPLRPQGNCLEAGGRHLVKHCDHSGFLDRLDTKWTVRMPTRLLQAPCPRAIVLGGFDGSISREDSHNDGTAIRVPFIQGLQRTPEVRHASRLWTQTATPAAIALRINAAPS